MKEHLFSVTKKDFDIQHFKGSGPGGQNKNKNATAVRIKHKESGAVSESQEMKSQYRNKMLAFDRLIKSSNFQIWLKKKMSEYLIDKNAEEYVDKWMENWFLTIETRKNNEWVKEEKE